MLTSIDYLKALNRLSFKHTLAAFKKKGASTDTMGILASFLSNQRMTVRVGNQWFVPKPVHEGVPQGSILWVLLFNIATDGLEDGCIGKEEPAAEDSDGPEPHDIESSEDDWSSGWTSDDKGDGDSWDGAPGASTPAGESSLHPVNVLPVLQPGEEADSFMFFPRAARRIRYSSEEDAPVPSEPSAWNHI